MRKLISRRIQITFVVGLLLGIVIGWLFSGLVSAVMRFGIAILLLVPLALAVMFWWSIRNAKPQGEGAVFTWTAGGLPPTQDDIFSQVRRDQRNLEDVVIDLDDIRREQKP